MGQTAHAQVQALLEEMKDAVKNPAKFQSLSDELSVLTSSYLIPTLEENTVAFNFNKSESRIFELLRTKIGKFVMDDAVMNAISFDKPDPPNEAIIKVHICRIRKKLAGSKYTIKTKWGHGYSLIEAANGSA